MKFRKIHSDGKKVRLNWTTQDGETTIHHSLESDELPPPELDLALNKLSQSAGDLCDMPKNYAVGFRPVAVSIDYKEDGRRGLVVSLRRNVEEANGPLNIATPRIQELKDEEAGVSSAVVDDLMDCLDAIEVAATAVAKGARAQTAMFEQPDEEPEPNDEPVPDDE